ncbi:MAG: IS200/IS605 family transposase [Patescibacteria group bacterium]|jgi:REP element-mobilizing transposase RayT
MDIKNQKIYHLVFATYKRKPILYAELYRYTLSAILNNIFIEKKIKVIIYKILSDHIHLLIVKQKNVELFWIIKLIKGISTYYFYQQFNDIKFDVQKGRLWAKGYWWELIKNEKQLKNTILYIKNNNDKYK